MGTTSATQSTGFVNPKTRLSWAAIVLVGIFGFLGQIFKTKGLALEKAGPAVLFQNLDLVLAYSYQILILHEPVVWLSLAGAALIVLSAVLLAVHKVWFPDTVETGKKPILPSS